ncbi:MAG: DUF3798 domain-containing protein [Lachnospiraceae bacterium]|nr:DUF3798 domain-containing protein [Lachnospiraceae bacterium]
MKKKILSLLLAAAMALALAACGSRPAAQTPDPGNTTAATEEQTGPGTDAGADPAGAESAAVTEPDGTDYRIGIVTGSMAQSEDDRRGAEAFREKYGEEQVTLAIYPDNFEEEYDTTVQTIVNLAEDPKMKAIIVNQAVPGTAEAFRQIRQIRPDIICIAGEAHEDIPEISEVADLVVLNDFVARGYLIVRSAHELGCDTFVHISFERHLSYDTIAREVAIMKAACEEFGMTFAMEEAPDPITEVGVPGAQAYITEHVPGWLETYGTQTAFFCTNDAHTEPLIRELLKLGGFFIEADLPSPMMGYPGALDLDLTEESGDFEKILRTVEHAVCEKGGAGRFGTWAYSYSYTVSAGLAEHVRNVILGEASLTDNGDIAKAFQVFSPGADWNGSKYIDTATGKTVSNTILIYQDTYIMGDPGYYMGSTKVAVPEKYFILGGP